jgi:uncharacterized membrane protein
MSTAKVAQEGSTQNAGFRIPLRALQFALVVIALCITGYMTYNKFAGQALPCSNTGPVNCEVVENSAWAYILGIPTATWGMAAHLLILAVLVLETRNAFFGTNGVLILFGITLFGVLYHSYLLFYVSIYLLGSLCPWCIAAAICMLLQFIITSIRLRQSTAVA